MVWHYLWFQPSTEPVPWTISPAEKRAYCNDLRRNEKVTGEISDVITLGQRPL